MRTGIVATIAIIALGTTALAEQRDLDAHEHGVGQLNIAIEGDSVVMELDAPGADIVGFEHPAESAEDRAAIDAAIAVLAKPLDLFALPENAQCVVSKANVTLAEEEEHAEDEHADHDEKHADHDSHDDEKHADHEAHGDEEESHTEFRAEYEMKCAQRSNITQIDFPYFDRFENARELEVQMITEKGATRIEVERENPRIDLSGMI